MDNLLFMRPRFDLLLGEHGHAGMYGAAYGSVQRSLSMSAW